MIEMNIQNETSRWTCKMNIQDGKTNNSTKQFFKQEKYSQLNMETTHTEGNILDHAYVRDERNLLKFTAEVQTKYFTKGNFFDSWETEENQ